MKTMVISSFWSQVAKDINAMAIIGEIEKTLNPAS